MIDKSKHIKPEERKTILLLADDCRMHSGIATVSREIILRSAHRFKWFQIGAALKHPEVGKTVDLSQSTNERIGIEDADVKVMPWNGYGDSMLVRNMLKDLKPDAIFIFTDPRYWVWLFEIEREIRNKIPIFWLNIWDDYPAPMYNHNFYDSVDVLMGISKQTVNINKLVLQEKAKDKVIKYVPHGIDDKDFFPVKEDHELYPKLLDFKKQTIPIETDFVLFFNSRNIHRKKPGDTLLAFKLFCDMIGEEKAKKCALVMHTAPSDNNGTDLRAVKHALAPDCNIFFSNNKISPEQMNFMYNMADATILISSNEGWGLSLTESMMCGTMIIPAVTGGMQDQCRFENEKGEWIDFDDQFPSNHRKTYTKCGEWAEPVFPSNITLAGSPATPYIFDDRVNAEDAALAIKKIYDLKKEEREAKGMKGYEWVMSDEAKMNATAMVKTIIDTMEEGFDKFVPRSRFDIIKIEERTKRKVTHKLTDY